MQIGNPRPQEREQAFDLLFRYCSDADRRARVDNALTLTALGELDPNGLFVLYEQDEIVGVVLCLVRPGALALIWPPQARDENVAHEDELVRRALQQLRARGVKIVQALLDREEMLFGEPLLRNGFRHVTALWQLCHFLDFGHLVLAGDDRCRYQAYDATTAELFHATLLETYTGTLDCPEMNGLRTIDEIVAGHKAESVHHRGDLWWLASVEERRIGVVLMTELMSNEGWEISYVGVIPDVRGCGFGRELMSKALLEAKCAGVPQVTLSVDERNRPARKLYRSLDFEPYDRREVLLLSES